jgi:hypothetical protein
MPALPDIFKAALLKYDGPKCPSFSFVKACDSSISEGRRQKLVQVGNVLIWAQHLDTPGHLSLLEHSIFVSFRGVPMNTQPTRVNENPHVIPAYGHAMACPYS